MHKRNHIEGAMRNHTLVINIVVTMVIFGIYALQVMNKDEFPQVTIRQGVMAAIYPGATAEEVELQVAKPLEDYLFGFNEIDVSRTYSISRDGIAYIFPSLQDDVDINAGWAKIRGGLSLMKQTKLPQGVLAIALIDNFGNTSSMLLAIESAERTPRELESYAEELTNALRAIKSTGNVRIIGNQNEEIAVNLDVERISRYALNKESIIASLASQGIRTVSGNIDGQEGTALIHVESPIKSIYDIGEMIVFSEPATKQIVRLKDVATIEHRYPDPNNYIDFCTHEAAQRCVMLNIEMAPGHNIVSYGKEIDKAIASLKANIPDDVHFHKVTDQPKVVGESVNSFLKDLFISILVVILVMMILFPLRTAIVASTSVPICTAVSFGIMYLVGLELNTVTLAAMIVVLGMIVDDSVIVIDGYTEMLQKGHSRWYCAAQSTKQLMVPMLLSTTSISAMFLPMLKLITGPFGDFVRLFPWAVMIALTCSIFFAIWVIPFMAFVIIKPQKNKRMSPLERAQANFFDNLQKGYTKLLDLCFLHPWGTVATCVGTVVLGIGLFLLVNLDLLPKADRDAFAIEIHLRRGSSLEETAAISDSLSKVLTADPRVKNVTSFVGMASPRFHAVYAPQIGGPEYGQFIVNTINSKATVDLVHDYQPIYENAFPNAYIRFKQIDYFAVANPIEVHVQGANRGEMERAADSIFAFLSKQPELCWVHSSNNETAKSVSVHLNEEASRLGITQSMLSLYLNMAMSKQSIAVLWDGDYRTPVRLISEGNDTLDCNNIGNLMIPSLALGNWVPLRQLADITPIFHESNIVRHNGLPTITISCDVRDGINTSTIFKPIQKYIKKNIEPELPSNVKINFGGTKFETDIVLPGIVMSVIGALIVLLLLLFYHFKRVTISILALSASSICLFGASAGLLIFDLPFTITAVLGVVSLIGIIVRNAIIMYEYADSLVYDHHMTSREAAYMAGQRRMRPIFLTSCTTALGVVPMIIAQSNLWMPMGVVICFGTLITLPLTITILPIAFWKVFERDTRRFERREKVLVNLRKSLDQREDYFERVFEEKEANKKTSQQIQ